MVPLNNPVSFVKKLGQVVLLLLVVAGALCFWHWKQGEPKRAAIASLKLLDQALQKGDAASLLQILVLPQAVQNKTPAEQNEFLFKALRDELSVAGLAELQAKGQFGPLTNIFPKEAAQWTSQAQVKPADCVAFRLDRPNGLRAEVVLARKPVARGQKSEVGYQILRCNNVR